MSAVIYDREQRCLGTDIFPQGGLKVAGLWEAKQELVEGSPPNPFRVSLLVAESSDKWRGLGEKNESETGLSHFAPS